jgi:hypothetical protein
MTGQAPGPGRHAGRLTRAQLLGGLGAGIVLGGGYSAKRAFGVVSVSTAARSASGSVRRFVSSPELAPPTVTVLHPAESVAGGYLFLAPSSGPGQRGTMIIDNAGEVVWFHPTTPNTAMNFRAALYRGAPVLTWWEGKTVQGLGVGEHVVFDQSYREIARFPAGDRLASDLHEFLITPQGTALVTAYEILTEDLASVGHARRGNVVGGVVQELEVPSARVLFEWHSLEHVALAESYAGVGDPFDYFHVNSIDVDADGNLLVSARNTWAVYKIDRASGEVIWRLGGKRSDFRMGAGTSFSWQHDARHHGSVGRLSLFDDADAPQEEPRSRALVLDLDTARMRATLVRAYTHSPALLAHALGSTQVLPNGNVLVGWGTEPYFTEYAPDGAVRLDAKLPHDGENYRTLRFPWTGRPSEPPALAARAGALYASWNGATELAAWRLLAGSSAGDLRPGPTRPRQGFETALAAPSGASHAAVAALDAAGKTLARSATLRLS